MSETAIYDDQGRFIGHSPDVAHHTTGKRAWSLEGLNEWCYPDTPCDSCLRQQTGDPWETIKQQTAAIENLQKQLAAAQTGAENKHSDLEATHSPECWRWHNECAVARIEDVLELHSHTYLNEKGKDMCIVCFDEESPCPTRRILDGDKGL